VSKKLIIFTDIGDTIVDEGTEVRNIPGGVVLRAGCIPGAKEAMLSLYEEGYTIAMVADGLVESFHNTMTQNGLEHIFAAKAISEALGVEKPHEKMFQAAMDALGLTDADKHRIIMVGNNKARDVLGANRFGITSVHLTWSPRYNHTAENDPEQADYRIGSPDELPRLVRMLNEKLG
jgi:putative hydrolase of the HAD superfamily